MKLLVTVSAEILVAAGVASASLSDPSFRGIKNRQLTAHETRRSLGAALPFQYVTQDVATSKGTMRVGIAGDISSNKKACMVHGAPGGLEAGLLVAQDLIQDGWAVISPARALPR